MLLYRTPWLHKRRCVCTADILSQCRSLIDGVFAIKTHSRQSENLFNRPILLAMSASDANPPPRTLVQHDSIALQAFQSSVPVLSYAAVVQMLRHSQRSHSVSIKVRQLEQLRSNGHRAARHAIIADGR